MRLLADWNVSSLPLRAITPNQKLVNPIIEEWVKYIQEYLGVSKREFQMSGQIKLSDWKIFEVLAEKGSFRKASEVLDLDSANIKRSVDKLESALNLKLFTRSPRGIRLTDDGISYQFRIKELMAPLEVELAEPKRKVVSVQYDARISFSRLLLLLEPLQANRFRFGF